MSRTNLVIGGCQVDFPGCGKLFEGSRDSVAREPVSPVEDPHKFHRDLFAYEAVSLSREFGHQPTGSTGLLRMVLYEVPYQNIPIKGDHRLR